MTDSYGTQPGKRAFADVGTDYGDWHSVGRGAKKGLFWLIAKLLGIGGSAPGVFPEPATSPRPQGGPVRRPASDPSEQEELLRELQELIQSMQTPEAPSAPPEPPELPPLDPNILTLPEEEEIVSRPLEGAQRRPRLRPPPGGFV